MTKISLPMSCYYQEINSVKYFGFSSAKKYALYFSPAFIPLSKNVFVVNISFKSDPFSNLKGVDQLLLIMNSKTLLAVF